MRLLRKFIAKDDNLRVRTSEAGPKSVGHQHLYDTKPDLRDSINC